MTTAREWVDMIADDGGGDLLVCDGLDAAIIGIGHQFNKRFVVYDRSKCIDIFITRDGMKYDDAEEFFEHNVVGAYVGDATPCFVDLKPEKLM